MSLFAVVLNEPNEKIAERIRDAYPDPDHIKVNETVYLVTGDMLIDTLLEKSGLMGESAVADAAGFALRLNGTYGGRTYRNIWDWFERATEVNLVKA